MSKIKSDHCARTRIQNDKHPDVFVYEMRVGNQYYIETDDLPGQFYKTYLRPVLFPSPVQHTLSHNNKYFPGYH